MNKFKCNTDGILFILEGRYKLARKGLGVPVPEVITLSDEETAHQEVQMALQRGWLLPVEGPKRQSYADPKVKEVKKCPHGFATDELDKCDYCAADAGIELPQPAIVGNLEVEDREKLANPVITGDLDTPAVSIGFTPEPERKGRKKKQ